jgi:flavin reductase (DIM6/NTAB) family NADH-FMN oxidoreductase RutF
MKQVEWSTVSEEAMKQIGEGGGAFLTVQEGERLNTMTIGWALLGIMWGRPVMTVAVRRSRHTFGIIEHSAEFTVSVPLDDRERELAYCGSNSGRDGNKFEGCGLSVFPGVEVRVPVIDLKGIHFECRIVYRNALSPALLSDTLTAVYPGKDYHTLYFGEIVNCYVTDTTQKR